MKKIKFNILICVISTTLLCSCAEKIKTHAKSLYSRHLQEHVPLQVFTTPLNSKEKVSLLLVCGNFTSLKKTKNILLDVYKQKKIRSSVVVYINSGKLNDADERTQEKFYSFINKELLPFVKKKSGIRKFQSISMAGIKKNGELAIGFAWNNADKIKYGIAVSSFTDTSNNLVLQQIEKSRKRPDCSLMIFESNENKKEDSSYAARLFAGKRTLQHLVYIRYPGKNNQEAWDDLLPEIFSKTLGD